MKKEPANNYEIEDLVELVKQGDQTAFSFLFNRLWQPLHERAYYLLGSSNIAEDIVQEVWIDFWKRRQKIQNDNVEAYLFKAVTFKVYKELRDTRFSTSQLEILEKLPAPLNTHQDLYLKDTQKKVDDILNDLPSRCKEVFILSRFKGFKNSEISEQLNISPRTVEAHISKAIKAMRKKLSYTFFFL